MATKLSDLRKALLANGYSPLPGKDKECKMTGWNDWFLAREAERHGSLEAAIDTWDVRLPDYPTTNVRIEKGLLPIDNDVRDPKLAAEVERIVAEVAPDVAANAPLRIRAGTPKCAWFARYEGEPFIEHHSLKYVSAADAAMRAAEVEAKKDEKRPRYTPIENYHHVEIFGGAPDKHGQCSRQFGVFGPHTVENGKVLAEYDWAEGPTLETLALKDLPVITIDQIWAILRGFEEAAERLGWVPLPRRARSAGGSGWVCDIDPDVTEFDTKDAGWVNYAELTRMVEAEGKVYCQATFIPGEVSDSFRCSAMWSDKYKCVMVEDWGGDRHLPIGKRPSWNGEGLALFARTQALVDKSKDGGVFRQLELTDFYAHMPDHKYIHIPSRRMWPEASINDSFGKIGRQKASAWLSQNRPVQQMTWSPGEPQLICDRLMAEGGWIGHRSAKVFNLYRPPDSDSWLAGDVSIWRNHLKRIYPDDWQDIELWMAQRAQKPADKINHAMVLGGRQGIGKDTILEPLRYAIGPWNFGEVTPTQMMGRFNGFLRSVVLRVNEVRDRGETDRYAFYNHSKIMIAAPPDTLLVDMKNTQEFLIPNVLGMVITLNEKASLYLSSDDRRHFVAWSELSQTDFTPEYFTKIYDWYYRQGGLAAVAQHLMTLDISGFDVKRPPRKTPAFHDIVRLSQAPEDASMAEALEALDRPDAVTISDVMHAAVNDSEFCQYLRAAANARKIGHRFEECGYTAVQNPDTKSGLWKIGERRVAVYAQAGLAHGARIGAARARAARSDKVVKLVPKTDK